MNCKNSAMKLEEGLNRLGYRAEILNIGENHSIIVTNAGMRVFGPFNGDDDPGFVWTKPDIGAARQDTRYEWNIGGDRIWIAPEIQYYCRDRSRFWDTLYVQKEIEPGRYKIIKEGNSVTVGGHISANAHNLATGRQEMEIYTTVAPLDVPGRYRTGNVKYSGYSIHTRLNILAGNAKSAIWNLTPVYPGGTLLVSLREKPAVSDYFKNLHALKIELRDKMAELPVSGDVMFKLGFLSGQITGKMIYFKKENTHATLMIKNFNNIPYGNYIDEPPENIGDNGYSVFVYYDGNAESFGEIECVSEACGGGTDKRSTELNVSTMFFYGAEADIISVLNKTVHLEDDA